MGILRLLLAIDVVLAHIGIPLFFAPMSGELAVTGFFIISGFYMAFILNEKYIGKNSYKLFITNRFLRIYPLYWIMLLLSLFGYIFFLHKLPNNPLDQFLAKYQLLTGFTLIRQIISDMLRVVLLVPNSVYIKPNMSVSDLLIIGPAWTLGLEFIFYLLAPFIVRRSLRFILVLTVLSYICRQVRGISFLSHGFSYNSLSVNVAFFPAVLFFFLLGVISYKIFLYIKEKHIPKYVSGGLFTYIVLLTILYTIVPGHNEKLYYFSLLLCIPFIFKDFGNFTLDRFLGNISYPMYISHVLIVDVILLLLPGVESFLFVLLLVLCCGIFAQFLQVVVEAPIDAYRQYRLRFVKVQEVGKG